MSTKSNNKRAKKSKKNGRVQRGSKTRWMPQGGHSSTVTRTRIAPDELDVKLMYRKIGSISNAGVSLGVVELKPNDAYDVDPSIGSTETYGFDEYAAIYSYYRVIGYNYQVTVSNTTGIGTDSPVMMYVTNTNTRVSSSGTRWDLYSTNPHCSSKLLALPYASGSTHTMRGSFQVSRILGSKVVETDDSYRALTTASPADLVWLGLAVENPTSGVGINFVYDIKVIMSVRFYGREVDLSLAGLAARVNAHLAARAERDHRKRLESAKASSALCPK